MDVENERFISPYNIKKKFDISSNTLRTWAEEDKVRYVRIRDGKGKRLYHGKDIERIFGGKISLCDKRKVFCYARVSSDHQKEDLNRQVKFLQTTYPEAEIIRDIGSGINFQRKGFKTLLEKIYNREVKTVVVTYKDRLCRFGTEIVEWLLKKSNTELVVLNTLSDDEKSNTTELAEDLLSITTVFVARNNGLRSAKLKRERKKKGLEEEKKTGEKDKEKKKTEIKGESS